MLELYSRWDVPFKCDRVETFFVGRAHRRLDAAVREEAAKHNGLNLLLDERGL